MTSSDNISFSHNQIEALHCFMASLEPFTSTSTFLFAQSGTLASTFSVVVTTLNHPRSLIQELQTIWRVCHLLFSSYFIYYGKDKVWVVDGSYSSIAGKGFIFVTPTLPFSPVLHVPKFSLNLLPISHLTKSLNCCMTFFPSHCVFQDLRTRTIISKGHEENKLYILNSAPHIATFVQLPSSTNKVQSSISLLQWH